MKSRIKGVGFGGGVAGWQARDAGAFGAATQVAAAGERRAGFGMKTVVCRRFTVYMCYL